MCMCFLNIAYTDWKSRLIRNKSVLGVLVMSFISMALFPEISVIERVVGSLLISLPLFVLGICTHGGVGGGDIKLMAVSGLGLGASGIWKAFVIGILASGIYVVTMLLHKKFNRTSEIALGPFLCLGLIVAWLI